jgi:ERCC4-type nuclease
MVVADDRERNSEVIKILSDVDNVSVAINRLAVGDYIVDRRASMT